VNAPGFRRQNQATTPLLGVFDQLRDYFFTHGTFVLSEIIRVDRIQSFDAVKHVPTVAANTMLALASREVDRFSVAVSLH
jgi:hypothetical protein